MTAHDELAEAKTSAMLVDGGTSELNEFWTAHRLQHKKEALREYLGTECLADLDDVHPGDLHTLRAVEWAQKTLSIAERNRLLRALKDYHACQPPQPEYGPQWFPPQGGLPGEV